MKFAKIGIASLVFFLLCFSLALGVRADGKELSLEKASEFYKQGKFEEAGEIYEAFLKENPDSTGLHYNLGNVYFKLKKIGKAILEYERAKNIKPRDYETNENLAYVQGLIEYKLEDKRNWYLIQCDWLADFFSKNEVLFVSVLLYSLLMSFLALRLLLKGKLKFLKFTNVLLVLFLVSLAPVLWKYYEERFHRDAVVVSSKAEIRYGPSRSDKVAFRLVEGLTVQVQDVRDGWYLVGLINGESGWCEKKDLELIQPLC